MRVAVTYGASGTLSKQIVAGAPVDVVVFAGPRPVDELVERGLADPDSRRVIATNSLVLVAADGNAEFGFDNIEELPEGERLAIGDPGSAPVGHYARQALRALGKWEAIRHRLVLGGDVAMVLAYARRREVAAAIVYATDLSDVEDLRVLDRASGRWAPRPEVVAGAIGESRRARRFIEFLESDKGQRLLDARGFDAP
ncbi:MAG: molybdate ABC transporter substrate-binding protein, partial [Candidatus Binatia bacterium]